MSRSNGSMLASAELYPEDDTSEEHHRVLVNHARYIEIGNRDHETLANAVGRLTDSLDATREQSLDFRAKRFAAVCAMLGVIIGATITGGFMYAAAGRKTEVTKVTR